MHHDKSASKTIIGTMMFKGWDKSISRKEKGLYCDVLEKVNELITPFLLCLNKAFA